jgi:hypothetical protein
MKLNFSQITILHDKNDSPAGAPASLLSVMRGAFPEIRYSTPYLPPGLPAQDALDFLTDNYMRMVHRDSLIVGFGRGGLLACALQQRVPVLRLSAFALNAPVSDGKVAAEMNENFYSRVSVYSSAFKPIKNNCNWASHSSMAYDVPWLANGDAYYPTAYLISAYGRHADMEQEIKLIFPAYQNPDTILG